MNTIRTLNPKPCDLCGGPLTDNISPNCKTICINCEDRLTASLQNKIQQQQRIDRSLNVKSAILPDNKVNKNARSKPDEYGYKYDWETD